MTVYIIDTQSIIEQDENGNPRLGGFSVEADSVEEAQSHIPSGYIQTRIEAVEHVTETRPISGRIKVEALPGQYDSSDEFVSETAAQILDQAAHLSLSAGSSIIWAEIQFRDPATGEWEDWDETGDAVEFNFSDPTNPKIRTLTPEEWKQASK